MFSSSLLMCVPFMTSPQVFIADDDMPRLSLGAKREAALIKSLNSKGYINRLDAASKLGQLHIRGSVPHLIGRLTDSNPQVRAEVVRALGLLKVSRVAPRIYKMLVRDPSPLVRAKAAVALGEMGYVDAKSAILALMDRPDIRERIAAVKALGKMGGAKVFRHLVRMLNGGSGELREAALQSLGEMGNRRGAIHVKRFIDSKNWGVQKAAMDALSRLEPAAVRDRLNQFLLTANPDFQLSALDNYARIGCSDCGENLKFLIEKASDEVAGGAASVAAWFNMGKLAPLIHSRMGQNPSVSAQVRFLWALGRLGYMPAYGDIALGVESPLPEVRLVALRSLQLLRPRDPRLVTRILPLTYDTEPSVAAEAYRLLLQYGYRGVVEKPFLKKLRSPLIITAVASGLPWLGKPSPHVVKRVRGWLNSTNHDVQKASVRTMGLYREASALSKLLSLLYHQDRGVKREAIFALGLINHPDGYSTLKYILSKEHDPVTRALAWLSLSLRRGFHDQVRLAHYCDEAFAAQRMAEAFIYAVALAPGKRREHNKRLKRVFQDWLSAGRNESKKGKLLELLLIHGKRWSSKWFEVAAGSPLYRVRAMALRWLARFVEPGASTATKEKPITAPVPSAAMARPMLKLPFDSRPQVPDRGCGCRAGQNRPRELTLLPLLLLVVLRRRRCLLR